MLVPPIPSQNFFFAVTYNLFLLQDVIDCLSSEYTGMFQRKMLSSPSTIFQAPEANYDVGYLKNTCNSDTTLVEHLVLVSEEESYNEAAQTLLTIGSLAHLSQSTQNQTVAQDHTAG